MNLILYLVRIKALIYCGEINIIPTIAKIPEFTLKSSFYLYNLLCTMPRTTGEIVLINSKDRTQLGYGWQETGNRTKRIG
jgi:hypothetical protein